MAEPAIKATDILSVKSRVSWAAIAAGAMISLAVYFLLTLLGVAVGLKLVVSGTQIDLRIGAGLWAITTLLFSMFIGGWATSRLAVGESKLEAFLYGVILWGVLFVGLFWMVGQGVRVGFGAIVGAASGAIVYTDDNPAAAVNNGPITTLANRYNTELGGDKFVDDLKKAGFTQEQAEKARDANKALLDKLKNDPASIPDQLDAAMNDPNNIRAAQDFARGSETATWYTLAGVVVSMLAATLGSLAGSGDMPVPVPLMGVRRAPTSPAPPKA